MDSSTTVLMKPAISAPNEDANIPKSFCSLNIIIVGGGIAGLSAAFCLGKAGHKITLIDSAPLLSEVGAGIQLSPNMSRLLILWGLQGRLDDLAVKPVSASFNRYDNDERIGYNIMGKRIENDHGSPYYHIHRADLIKMLHDLALPFSVFKIGKVVSVTPTPSPAVTLETGEVIQSDLILGADGMRSIVRETITQEIAPPFPSGDRAFRAIIPTDSFQNDPELKSLVDTPQVTCWMGPGRHIVGYCVRRKKEYNMVLVHPDTGSDESWTATATGDEVREEYSSWIENKRVTKLLSLVESALKSKLVVRPPLGQWVDAAGRIALVGDSCHPMLPYLAQGGAMAVEDAAVLGNLLSHISHPSQIKFFLKAYQGLRSPRTAATQRASLSNRGRFHLPDGVEQQARDKAMKTAMEATLREDDESAVDMIKGGNSSVVTNHDKVLAGLQFDYDANEAADNWWRGLDKGSE